MIGEVDGRGGRRDRPAARARWSSPAAATGRPPGWAPRTLGGGRAYLNLGTAAVSGVWGADFATSPAFRTLTSLSGDGYIFELCLRTGAFLTDWTRDAACSAPTRRPTPAIYDRLEAEAAAVPPGADGLLLLPYWSGAMTPFWDPDARGAVVGLGTGHGRGHYYRALMEGVALDLRHGLRRDRGRDRRAGPRAARPSAAAPRSR